LNSAPAECGIGPQSGKYKTSHSELRTTTVTVAVTRDALLEVGTDPSNQHHQPSLCTTKLIAIQLTCITSFVNNKKQVKSERTMHNAALLIVLASDRVGGLVDVVASIAVDVIADSSSTVFLSLILSVKIVIHAADEVLSAVVDKFASIVRSGLRLLPMVVNGVAVAHSS
jgi:hypothetical protein